MFPKLICNVPIIILLKIWILDGVKSTSKAGAQYINPMLHSSLSTMHRNINLFRWSQRARLNHLRFWWWHMGLWMSI